METKKNKMNEIDCYKVVAFYLVRAHRVRPSGRKLKKTNIEIDDMSLATVEYMAKNVKKETLDEYRAAAERKGANNRKA